MNSFASDLSPGMGTTNKGGETLGLAEMNAEQTEHLDTTLKFVMAREEAHPFVVVTNLVRSELCN